MKGLMLHCGAEELNREALASLPVPPPMGARHAIRPFIEDVVMVGEFLAEIGMPITNEGFGVTATEEGTPKQFFGLLEVQPFTDDRDHGIMIGMRGSYDQTLPRGLAVGSNVFVCDNLCFSGEVNIKTKQTLDIDSRIAGLLRDAIDQVPGLVTRQDNRFSTYRETRIGQTVGNSLLTDMVRTGVLNPSQLGKAITEWDSPSHEEHAENGWSLWRLHNAVTEALKPANAEVNAVRRNWSRTIGLTELIDAEVHRREFNAHRRGLI